MYILSIVICAFVLLHAAHATRISLLNRFFPQQKKGPGAHPTLASRDVSSADELKSTSPSEPKQAASDETAQLKSELSGLLNDQDENNHLKQEPVNITNAQPATVEQVVKDGKGLDNTRTVQALFSKKTGQRLKQNFRNTKIAGNLKTQSQNESAALLKNQEEEARLQRELADSLDSQLAEFEQLVKEIENSEDKRDPRDQISKINDCRRNIKTLLNTMNSPKQKKIFSSLEDRLNDYIEEKYARLMAGDETQSFNHVQNLLSGLSDIQNVLKKLDFLHRKSGYFQIRELLRKFETKIVAIKTRQSADPELDSAIIRALRNRILTALQKRPEDEESQEKYLELSKGYDGWEDQEAGRNMILAVQRIQERDALERAKNLEHSSMSSEPLEGIESSLGAHNVPLLTKFISTYVDLPCPCKGKNETFEKIVAKEILELGNYFKQHASPSEEEYSGALRASLRQTGAKCDGVCTGEQTQEQVAKFVRAVIEVKKLDTVLKPEELREVDQYAREIVHKVQSK